MSDNSVRSSSTPGLAAFVLVEDRLRLVEREIERACHSEIALVRKNAEYLHRAGGKRIRPTMVLLCAEACGYEGDGDIKLAAVVEFIHTATLVHDDIVDGAEVRRGHATANQVWGNKLAVLLGDYVYIRSMSMSVALGDLKLVKVLAAATSRLLEGEILDVSSNGDSSLSEESYVRTIDRKTAALFEVCGHASAIIADASKEHEEALATYGRSMGMAFQLVDDLLDYCADQEKLGKRVGADLREGKMTLPAIYLLEDGSAAERDHLSSCLGNAEVSEDDLIRVVESMERSGALDRARVIGRQYADAASASLAVLPESRAKDALAELPDFVLSRQT